MGGENKKTMKQMFVIFNYGLFFWTMILLLKWISIHILKLRLIYICSY